MDLVSCYKSHQYWQDYERMPSMQIMCLKEERSLSIFII